VEAIGRNSNLGHLCKKWSELRKRIHESPARPPRSRPDAPKHRSKRFLTAEHVTDIVDRYESGETTQEIGKRYGISKTRVASILTYHGVPIRRQGLNEEQVNEAARLYIAGKSLAWIGAVYAVSHTTVAAALRRKDVELRPRPGWV
jgi:Sigma-70, region 4